MAEVERVVVEDAIVAIGGCDLGTVGGGGDGEE